MKKASPIKETIEKQLGKMEKARRRAGLLRETALLRLRWVPNVRKIIEYFAEALFKGAGAQPLDPRPGRSGRAGVTTRPASPPSLFFVFKRSLDSERHRGIG